MLLCKCFLVLAFAGQIFAEQVFTKACAKSFIGSTSGEKYPVQPQILLPGQGDWKLLVPEVVGCPKGAEGVVAMVCDEDVLPTTEFIDLKNFIVHRHGDLKFYAVVLFTVYC